MREKILKYSEIFRILSNPVRLCILTNLITGERKNVSELINCSNVSQSVVSQQLNKLKLAGILKCEKIGNEVYYELKDEKISNVVSLLIKD